MLIIRRLLLVVIVVAIMVGGWNFAAHNGETVTVDFVYAVMPGIPLWQLLLISSGLGLLLGWLLISYRLARASLVSRRYRKTIKHLEAEVSQLRNLPLDAEPGSLPEIPQAPDAVLEAAAGSSPGR